MPDYVTLAEAYLAVGETKLNTVLSWYNHANPNSIRANLNGAGNDVDAWRHGGTAALLAYEYGYQ